MIALGCDHGGYELMQEVIKYLEEHGLEYKNYGTYSTDSCDYPDYAKKVAEAILAGECEKGILICGTGIGITIAANRYEGTERPTVQTALWRKLQESIMMPIFLVWEHVSLVWALH